LFDTTLVLGLQDRDSLGKLVAEYHTIRDFAAARDEGVGL